MWANLGNLYASTKGVGNDWEQVTLSHIGQLHRHLLNAKTFMNVGLNDGMEQDSNSTLHVPFIIITWVNAVNLVDNAGKGEGLEGMATSCPGVCFFEQREKLV